MYFLTATKGKICAIGALLCADQIILMKKIETWQWHNKVCATFLLKCFAQRKSQASLLASTSWVEGTQDSDSWKNVSDRMYWTLGYK